MINLRLLRAESVRRVFHFYSQHLKIPFAMCKSKLYASACVLVSSLTNAAGSNIYFTLFSHFGCWIKSSPNVSNSVFLQFTLNSVPFLQITFFYYFTFKDILYLGLFSIFTAARAAFLADKTSKAISQ